MDEFNYKNRRWAYFIENQQVFPMNPRSLELKEALEDEFIRAYRKNFTGTIILINRPDLGRICFTYLKSLETDHRDE